MATMSDPSRGNASRVGSFFKRVDRQQAFHEDFEKLDKTAEFLTK